MTDATETRHEEAVRSEEDRISSRKIIAVGLGALFLFTIASLLTTAYLQMRVAQHPPIPIPPEVGQSKIGLVEQQLFELADRGQKDRAARLRHLDEWGWIDRERGVVHVPISDAMRMVVEGVRPPPGPPPPPLTSPAQLPQPGGQL
jgi:hypothetical protein